MSNVSRDNSNTIVAKIDFSSGGNTLFKSLKLSSCICCVNVMVLLTRTGIDRRWKIKGVCEVPTDRL